MVKDKNKPKGPMSAYACFVQVIREEHKKKHPEESVVFSEFSKKCAEKWKTMTDTEKKRFDDMACRDKERYIREMDSYVPPEGMKKPRKRRRNKDPGQPKRALSAFFFFCEEKRPAVRVEHPEWKVGDIAKELGRQWEMCQCKSKYEGQAIADKSRYEREMIEYKNGTFLVTKRARLEDVVPAIGEASGMTPNGYLVRPAGAVPQYGVAPVAATTPGVMAHSQAVPKFEPGTVKTELAGPSFGTPADGAMVHPSFAQQAFPQPAASQPKMEPHVISPQGYVGMSMPPAAAPEAPPSQPHPTPGGDTVDLSAERNGATAIAHAQIDSGAALEEEEDEEDEEEEEEEEDEDGDE